MSTRKKLLIGALVIVVAMIGGGAICSKALAMPAYELQENYSTGADGNYTIQRNEWYAQTFTVSPESHSINEIRIFGYREGEPGTVTISLRDTDDSGLPTGTDLTSGTFDGDAVTNSTTGAWCAVVVTETNLDYDEVYAVVIRAEAGDVDNTFHIKVDESSPTYSGGSAIESSDSGVTWSADASTDAYFEIYGKALLEVSQAKVFSGYVEDDDLLITLEYWNEYTPYWPNEDSNSYFYIQLRDSTGATILKQTTCNAWGLKPGSIYISADEASGLTVGGTYRVYLVGNLDEEPTAYYTIVSSDWKGDDLTLLDSWVITTAHELEDEYEETFTDTSGTNEILNEQGGVIFATGILGLQYVRPDIFAVSVYIPGYDEADSTNAYEESTTWREVLGTGVATFFDAAGEIVGLEDGRDIGAGILVAVYLGLCILIVARKGDALVGAGLGIPIIIAGSWLHLIDIVFILVVAAIGVFFTMYKFWWART